MVVASQYFSAEFADVMIRAGYVMRREQVSPVICRMWELPGSSFAVDHGLNELTIYFAEGDYTEYPYSRKDEAIERLRNMAVREVINS